MALFAEHCLRGDVLGTALVDVRVFHSKTLPRVLLVYYYINVVHDDGHISRGGARSGTTSSAAFSSVCYLGFCHHTSRGRNLLTRHSDTGPVRRSLVGFDRRLPFRLRPNCNCLMGRGV